MALTTALYTGVSGLNSNGQSLSIIGDNIANANTIGYKGSRAIFADVLSQSLGGGSALQIGRGSFLAGTALNFSQGTMETTSNPLDMAIEGDGFFVVKQQLVTGTTGTTTSTGASYYTRAGQFHLDKNGNITNSDGMMLGIYRGPE